MNTKNNRRRRESVEKIEKAFVKLLQTEELKRITVADICKESGLNRSTFYANFLDVYDLADQLRGQLESEFSSLFSDPAELSGLFMRSMAALALRVVSSVHSHAIPFISSYSARPFFHISEKKPCASHFLKYACIELGEPKISLGRAFH